MAERQERRQASRIAIVGRPGARARGSMEVWLVDLSITGARIASGDMLPHGSTCTLELPSALGSLKLSARVVWSGIFGGEQTADGERHITYQSGLAFVDLTTDQSGVLTGLVEGLTRRRGRGGAE